MRKRSPAKCPTSPFVRQKSLTLCKKSRHMHEKSPVICYGNGLVPKEPYKVPKRPCCAPKETYTVRKVPVHVREEPYHVRCVLIIGLFSRISGLFWHITGLSAYNALSCATDVCRRSPTKCQHSLFWRQQSPIMFDVSPNIRENSSDMCEVKRCVAKRVLPRASKGFQSTKRALSRTKAPWNAQKEPWYVLR